MDKHGIRIEIFNHTLQLLQQGWYLSGNGNKVELPGIVEVMGAAKMYNAPFAVNMRNPDHGRPVNPFKIPLKRYPFTY